MGAASGHGLPQLPDVRGLSREADLRQLGWGGERSLAHVQIANFEPAARNALLIKVSVIWALHHAASNAGGGTPQEPAQKPPGQGERR
jgi:hypothetical protein